MKTITLFFFTALLCHARVVEYDLTIERKDFTPGNGLKSVPGLTVNGGIPGPTLRFREGDTARIRVHNRLSREETSVHWHGIVLPVAQDGVPGVTTPAVQPGGTHTFEFKLLHSGTYWYHSHTGLQEQRGVYGSIVVEPAAGEAVKSDRDHVVVLSDWTLESPEEVMRSLRRGSDWYELKKGSIQSVAGAAKAGALKDFFERERSRMPAMDISDVAYDAFLANGRTSIHLDGKPGETVRLRFINAAASTYFYLQSATGPLKIVAADGPPVKPISVNRLLTGMAETYDVIVKIPPAGQWEVRATAQDGSGYASVFLGDGERHPAPDVPRPDNYRMDSHLMAAMDEMDMGEMDMSGHDHSKMAATENERPLPPYARLRSPGPTDFPASLPRRTLEMRLTGDMERYIWSFNNKTFAEDGVIPIKHGEVIRLEFINDTMMHHPIHLHGHFFRVLAGQGDDAPLKHTIDVPPMGKRTVEFQADNDGDWLLHCHLLYHMHAGMTRIFAYQDKNWTPPTQGKLKPGTNTICTDDCCVPAAQKTNGMPAGHLPHAGGHDHDPFTVFLDGSLQSHLSEGVLTVMNSRNDFFAAWEMGYRDETEYEADLGWKRYFNPNFSTLLGWRFTNHEDEEDRAFAGLTYRLPYLIDSSVQIDSEGDLRLGLGKSLQITARLNVFAETQYDTHSKWEWSSGATYMINKQFSLITQYHSDYGFGGGLQFRF